jgi:hypothetical protein
VQLTRVLELLHTPCEHFKNTPPMSDAGGRTAWLSRS